MFGYIQSFLIVILEVLCCKIFYETFGVKRSENNVWKDRRIFVGLMLFIYFAAFFLRDQFLLKQILVFIVTAVLMLMYLKITFSQSMILAALFQGLLLVVDYLAYLLNIFFFQSLSQMDELYYVQGSLIFMLGKVILFFAVLIIRKYMGKDIAVALTGKEWIRFIFFPVFTIGTVTAMLINLGGVKNQEQETLYFIIGMSLVGLNIIVFYLVRDILRREREIHEKTVSELQVKKQINIYQSIAENYDKQRKQTHEYQNQIMCIEFLLNKKDYSQLAEYVAEIRGCLGKELNYFQTNHTIVDAILNTKYQETLDKNIIFVVKVNDLSNINIGNDDIVIILSNLLNNAIEACEQCHDRKVIKLKFVKEDGATAISVTNTYENEIVYHAGHIQTSKAERVEEHGFGIRNIVEAVTKYDGSYNIQINEGEFCFFIKISDVHKPDVQLGK